jgi:hypothetical protein
VKHANATVDMDAIIETVERKVLARIAAALVAAPLPAYYSTRRKCGPPGLADSACKALLPTLPGAVQRGRWWVIDRARYEEWEASQAATSTATEGTSPPAKDRTEEPWSPRGALESVGLRATRRTR